MLNSNHLDQRDCSFPDTDAEQAVETFLYPATWQKPGDPGWLAGLGRRMLETLRPAKRMVEGWSNATCIARVTMRGSYGFNWQPAKPVLKGWGS